MLVPSVLGASEDSSTGTATVLSTSPTISSPELWDAGESTPKNNTAIDVNVEYHVNMTISDSNTMADLDNITFYIYEDTNADWDSADSQQYHYTMTWTESTDIWAEVGPEPPDHIVTANCKDCGTGSGLSQYEFTLAFKLDRVALHLDTVTWKINCTVFDDSANVGKDETLVFSVNFYSDIQFTDTTHAWSSLEAGDTDEPLDGDEDIDFNVIANANWDAQAKANQTNLVSGSDTMGVGNITIHKETLESSVSLTTSYVDIGGLTGQTPPTDDDSPVTTYCKLWIDVPATQPAGAYVYDLDLQIIEA